MLPRLTFHWARRIKFAVLEFFNSQVRKDRSINRIVVRGTRHVIRVNNVDVVHKSHLFSDVFFARAEAFDSETAKRLIFVPFLLCDRLVYRNRYPSIRFVRAADGSRVETRLDKKKTELVIIRRNFCCRFYLTVRVSKFVFR